MEVYFKTTSGEECGNNATRTIRNDLVQEENAIFGFYIVKNKFLDSPFKLYSDDSGTNMYEVKASVSGGSGTLSISSSDVSFFAQERRKESLSATASVGYSGLLVSASVKISGSQDSEQTNLFKSSASS
jgi:hypothetical protein